MIEYKSDGLVVFVTSVGGGGSGEGGGSGGQMHPASLEKLITREDELEAENARLREALQSIKTIPNSEAAYGIIQTFVDDALKEKE
jgi:hypothetical protein